MWAIRGSWNLTIKSFATAAQNPNLAAAAKSYLALTYCILGDLSSAESAIREAAARDPKCEFLWMAWNSFGVELAKMGYPDRALVAYSSAQASKPDEPELWFNMGVAYHEMGNRAQASQCYQQCVLFNPQHGAAWHNLGLIHAQEGQHEQAVRCFETIVTFEPENLQAWHDLGVSLKELGRDEESAAALGRTSDLTRAVEENL